MKEKEFFSLYSNNKIDDRLRKVFDILNFYSCNRCFSIFDSSEKLDKHRKNVHDSNTRLVLSDPSNRLEKIMDEEMIKKPIETSRFTCYYSNINGLYSKYEYLNKVILAFKRNIDIIILVESKIESARLAPFLAGYTSFKCDAIKIGRVCSAGLVIYVRSLPLNHGNIY
jgi:hypothetical protein